MYQSPEEACCLVSKITLTTHKGMKGKHVLESPGPSIRTDFQWAGLCRMVNYCEESSPFQGIAGAQLGRSSELLEAQYLQGGDWSNVPIPFREIETIT